jgi:hypothetical protein
MYDLIVIATHNLSHVAQLFHLLSSCPSNIVKKFMETPLTRIFKSLYISQLHIINSVPLTVPRILVPAHISTFVNHYQSAISLVPFLLQNMVKKFVGHSLHQVANQPIKSRFLSHVCPICPAGIVKKFVITLFTRISTSLYFSQLRHNSSVPLTVPRISVPVHISQFISYYQSVISLVPFLLQNMVKKFVGHSLHQVANQPIKGRKLSHACPICPAGIVKKFVITLFTRISTSLYFSQLRHNSSVPLTVPRISVPVHISVFVSHCHSAVSRVPHLMKYMVKKFVGHSLHQIANQPIKSRKLSHAHSAFCGSIFQNSVPRCAFALKNPKSKALERL